MGSMLRYLVAGYVQHFSGSTDFPYGTLAVNVIGCLLIGVLTELASIRGALTPEIRALLVTGVLGGFTTFSTFGLETMNLLRDGQLTLALLNMGISLLTGLGAVWSGLTLAYLIWR